MLKTVIFDFGGVLADEGFKEGLKAIADKNNLEPDKFFHIADELIYKTGYIRGMAKESEFWNAMRKKTGIKESMRRLRYEIIKRFVLRKEMLMYVDKLRARGLITAILSDQTNWIEEINQKTHFYESFDYVFNSFRLGKGKKDPSVFKDVCKIIGVRPSEVLFVDDNLENIKRAEKERLKTIYFKDITGFKREIQWQVS